MQIFRKKRAFALPFLALVLALAALPRASGQTARAYAQAADEAFAQKNYAGAAGYYAEAESLGDRRPYLRYQQAECARGLGRWAAAGALYRQLWSSPDAADFPALALRLGECAQRQGDYAEALAWFGRFVEGRAAHPDVPWARQQMAACRWAMQPPLPASLAVDSSGRLGDALNTYWSEFAPFPLGDSLYYAALRPPGQADAPAEARVFLSTDGGRGRRQAGPFRLADKQVANAAFSASRRYVAFSACDWVEGELRCAIYLAGRRGQAWQKAQALGPAVNVAGYTSTQPAFVGDSLLIFASDRPGGRGGLDLWQKTLGDTLPARPLAALNTPGDEASPYVDAASGRLFFASTWHLGYGGYDVFEADWPALGTPRNLGPGVNSHADELYFVLAPQAAYWASNQPGPAREADEGCCFDLYAGRWHALPPPSPAPLPDAPPPSLGDSVAVAQVDGPAGLPEPRHFSAENPEKNGDEFVTDFRDGGQDILPSSRPDTLYLPPVNVFFANDQPRSRSARDMRQVPEYPVTFAAYFEERWRYEEIALMQSAAAAAGIGYFFEKELAGGMSALDSLRERLALHLASGQRAELDLAGHTSPRAASAYNLKLAERRTYAVARYLLAHPDLAAAWEGGRLRLLHRAWGEAQSPATLSDALDDEAASVYSLAAARERRVRVSARLWP